MVILFAMLLFLKLGIAQAIQNLGLGLIALLVGVITDKFGYFWLEVFFMGCLCLAIITSVIMWVLDYKDENYLNMTISQRKLFETTVQYRIMMDEEIPSVNDSEESTYEDNII